MDALRRTSPHAVALARVVSLAVHVDRALLRQSRLALVPGAGAEAEAYLWFSLLVEDRNSLGFSLQPGVAQYLRSQLQSDREALSRARRLVAEQHRHAPLLVRLEEELIWLGLSEPDSPTVDAYLRSALRNLADDIESRRVAEWALRAVPNMPPAVRQRPEARQILLVAALLLGETPPDLEHLDLDDWPSWLRAPLIQGVKNIELGIRFVGDRLELGDPDLLPDCTRLRTAATTPCVLRVSWQDSMHAHTRIVELAPGTFTAIEAHTESAELRFFDGRAFRYRKVPSELSGATT